MTKMKNQYIQDLYQAYRNRLIEFAGAQMNGNMEAATDLVADAFLQFIKRDDFFRACRKSTQIKALYRITQQLCDKYLEKNQMTSTLLLKEETSYAVNMVPVMTKEEGPYLDHVYMEDLVANLYGEDRELVELYYFKGMSSKDVSAAMGLSMEAFYKKHQRALEKLRWFEAHS